jgi:subtilase family serine protease
MKNLLFVPLFVLTGFFLLQTTGYAKEKEQHVRVCSRAKADDIGCHARVVVENNGSPKAAVVPVGYGPAQLRGAYGLSSAVASGSPILAIVDAYDHPNIKSALDKYSSTFGIPTLPTCAGSVKGSSVPCFKKLNQRGSTSYPSVNAGWALEISLDVEVAHATCQNCKILLVEADSSSYANLMAAVDQAVAQGATYISNSYGSAEFPTETNYDSHFNKPGLVFTFSSGDNGYGSSYPAASRYVTAVGGTTLTLGSGNTYGSETAWSGAGSGCSAYEAKPSWQLDRGCANRIIADVSADADPVTGAAVYDSVRYQGKSGWFKVGGTSLAAPLIAGVYALAGNVGPTTFGASVPYGNADSLHDVISGSNGSCGGIYLCTALRDYDGPTGLGSPNGISAF